MGFNLDRTGYEYYRLSKQCVNLGLTGRIRVQQQLITAQLQTQHRTSGIDLQFVGMVAFVNSYTGSWL